MQVHRVTYRLRGEWKVRYFCDFSRAVEAFRYLAMRGLRAQYVLGSMDESQIGAPGAHMMY